MRLLHLPTRSTLSGVVVLGVMWFAPTCTHALSVSGSFSGIAHAEAILGGDPDLPASYYDGAQITGTFRASIPDDHLATWSPEYLLTYGTGSSFVQFQMKGKTFSFPSTPSDSAYPGFLYVGDASPDNPTQTLSFHDHYYLKYHGAAFSFTSPPETLFRNRDLTTIQITPATVSQFDTYFLDSNTFLSVNVDVQSFTLNLAAPVPEPGAALLLGLGSGVVGGVVTRRRRTAAGRGRG